MTGPLLKWTRGSGLFLSAVAHMLMQGVRHNGEALLRTSMVVKDELGDVHRAPWLLH
jgi:hypothetical protein